MAFAGELKERRDSNYERAIMMLQNREKPEFHQKDGKFYAFGMELSEDEYNRFLDKVNIALEIKIDAKRQDLEQAA